MFRAYHADPAASDGRTWRRWYSSGGANASAAHYYVTILRGTAIELGGLIRCHWAVENERRWCLFVSFREDANKTAVGHTGVNLGLIRRVATSLLEQDPGKGSEHQAEATPGGPGRGPPTA